MTEYVSSRGSTRPQGVQRTTFLSSTLPAAALLTASFLAAACGETGPETTVPGTEPVPIAELRGSILTSEPVLVVPGLAWQTAGDDGEKTWTFADAADWTVQVGEEAAGAPLTLILDPSAPVDPTVASASWGDLPLEIKAGTADTLEIKVDGALLEPGLHRLGLAVPGNPTFEAITARHGERNHPISAGLMPRYRYLYSFLGLGVTGSYGNEKNGGFLFMGSRSQTLDLGHDQGGELAFRVQNSTNGPGSVKIGFGQDLRHAEMSADLEPHERRDLRIPVPAGQRYATLASSGPDAGLFLWGAPRFRSFLTGGPPVVIITLDTTRRDALSPYAPEVTWTPRLQALADRSTVFDHAHATSPWTLPSHGSLFTGLYPSRHGAGVATHRLEPGIPSLAELLADAGYTNGGVAGGPFTRFTHGLARGFDVYHSPEGYETYADELTDFGLQFLDGFGDGPFLLFLNYFDPHFPYRAPDAYRERFDLDRRIEALPDGPWRRALGTGDAGAFQTIIDRDAPPDEETLALALDTYRAEVAYTDAQVGRLLDALDAAGRFDEALIIVTSDHGESLGEGGNFSHSIRLDPELIEIPLIVKWPGQTEPSRVTELASLVDIFATVLEVAGVEDPGFVDAAGGPGRRDGLTLAQDGGELHRRGWLLMEEHDAPHHTLFESTKIADHLYGVQEAGRRQVLWEGGETCAEGVPGAWRSTGCDAEVLARSRALAARLQREARRSDLAPQALSEEERARLKALGYIR